MELKFLGNGSGFSETHTGAFFTDKDDFVFIDCSMLNIQKMLSLKPFDYKNTYILITHMHDDHVSGVNTFLQYMYYIYNKQVNIVVPEVLKADILKEFKIKGIPEELYTIILTNELNKDWFKTEIKTKHVPELKNKCFGYQLNINNKNIVYSGDTCIIDNYLPFLDIHTEFYVDVSANYGKVHLKYDDVKAFLNILSNAMDIYLMHIDSIEDIKKKIEGTKFKIVEII